MRSFLFFKGVLALFLGLTGLPAQAVTLSEAAQQAVLQNPEVQVRWRAFNGTLAQQDAARGGYFPRVDITAGVGREHLEQPNQADKDFNRRGLSASLNQMLFDGFATRSEVRRLGYLKLVRYYELLDISENTASEAIRAYYDVLRYRKLVKLAEENYAQHRLLFDQMEQRVKAGVGRRVDFEQAGGRLSLSESNLLTEVTNLHDVSARYQRIVGELPPTDMAEPALLQTGVPPTSNAAVLEAIKQSPVISAAIENIRSSQMDQDGRNAGFMPRVELRARQDLDHNRDGILGSRQDRVVEMVLNYNLFRGGSDSALKRQAVENLYASKDLRDKACRDVRQTLAIAYNDTRRIAEQLRYLDAHQLAAEKARDAYRKQFDIGQRTLLDLLDTENELFQARRAHVNSTHDHGVAYARTHAAMGTLLAALNLRRIETPSPSEMGEDPFEVDPATACPPQTPVTLAVDKPAAVARIAALYPMPQPVPAPVAKPVVVSDEEQVRTVIKDWITAWAAKKSDAYLAMYSMGFVPANGGARESWAKQRIQRLAQPGTIALTIDNINVRLTGADTAISEFRQTYHSDAYQDVVNKTLHWRREAGRWMITQEIAGK